MKRFSEVRRQLWMLLKRLLPVNVNQVNQVADIELNLLCVVKDMVLWHVVVDHRHAMMVPNKSRHCSRRPAVSH